MEVKVVGVALSRRWVGGRTSDAAGCVGVVVVELDGAIGGDNDGNGVVTSSLES